MINKVDLMCIMYNPSQNTWNIMKIDHVRTYKISLKNFKESISHKPHSFEKNSDT